MPTAEAKAEKFDTSAQTANSDILDSDVDPTHKASALRFTIALKSAAVVNIQESDDSTTVGYDLNAGATLDADELHSFDVPVRDGKTYNIQVESGVGLKTLKVDEVRNAEV